MSTVLVAYATKMGSNKEIAERIGATLTENGLTVTVLPAAQVPAVSQYDAVILGSALYMFRWRPEAVRFLRRHRVELAARPFWLFHSGAFGEDAAKPQQPPSAVRGLAEQIGAHGPATFGGRLTTATAKGFLARRMAKGPNAGDFRDWDKIREWATGVAQALRNREGTHAPRQE